LISIIEATPLFTYGEAKQFYFILIKPQAYDQPSVSANYTVT